MRLPEARRVLQHDDYLRKWLAKDADERPVLRRDDGVRLQDLPRE